MTTISGIDIYRYQQKIDWSKARAIPELRFVYAKSTQGVGWTDPMFKIHRDGAIAAGKDFGCLHFLDHSNYPRGKEIEFGAAQADYCWSVIKDNPGQCGIVCDTETNEGANWEILSVFSVARILKIALAFHIRMKELSGRFGGDYAPSWVTEHMKNFKEGFAFLPRYKTVKDLVTGKWIQPAIDHFFTHEELKSYLKPACGAFDKYTIFQYSSLLNGRIIGWNGPIDADIFNGTEEEYSVWLGKTCVPTYPTENEAPIEVPLPVPFQGKNAVVISAVNIRNGVGTGSPQMSAGGVPMVARAGEVLEILESKTDTAGNPWIRCGFREWACVKYNGSELLKIK